MIFFSYIMKKLMKNECHRRKYPDLSCFHTKNEEIFAIFAPEISTFDAPTWHSTSQLFDGRLLKTSIPLKSQNHVLSFNNFKCQWNGLNIFVTIVDTKTSLLLKSGIDGNSILKALSTFKNHDGGNGGVVGSSKQKLVRYMP